MLIIDVSATDSLDKALKQYKRKFDRTGVMKELRQRKEFSKSSVKRRAQILKASYKQQSQQIWN